jgi:tRNA/tmRNA/rRNA uracil-C5-methylase (TrmA/RlmC/RlmD family)
MPDARVTIDDIAYGGDGVGRLDDGVAVFVPFTAVGDVVDIELVEQRKRFARGRVVDIITPGPGRSEAECQVYGTCGGCRYQHLDADTEHAAKLGQLSQQLRRLGGLDELPEINPIVRSPQRLGYRNKISLKPIRGEDRVGYGYSTGVRREMVEVRECPLAHEKLNALLPKVPRTKWGKQNAKRKAPRPLTLRIDSNDDTHFFFGYAPRNIPWIHQDAPQMPMRVPLGGFAQVNSAVAGELVSWAADQMQQRPCDVLVDAYCGAGAFAIAGAAHSSRVYGLEIETDGIRAAIYNAESNGFENCIFYEADVGESLHQVLDTIGDDESARLLLDPPRDGCAPVVVDQILAMPPQEIIYISCNVATMARDIRKLTDTYQVTQVGYFDMFPCTAHFESVAVLQRK